VKAAHGEVKALRIRVVPALDFTDAPPVQLRRITILFVAGHDAALAADTLRHVEVKSILFAGFELARWYQRPGLDLDLYQGLGPT
jgi:hypothetical protein